MAGVLLCTVMVGALSLSGVVAATAGPAAQMLPAVLSAPGPDIALSPKSSVAVAVPDGSRAYVADGEAATLTAYDLATGTVLAVIPMPGIVSALTASRDGATIYAGSYGNRGLVTVSTASNSVTATLALDDVVFSMAETADGKFLLMMGLDTLKHLYVVDTATGTLAKSISMTALGDKLESLAVSTSSDASIAYISRAAITSATTSASDVAVVDLDTEKIVRTIEPCGAVGEIAFTEDGSKGYFGCGDGQVAVVATSTGAILETVDVGFQVSFAQLTAGGTRLVVAGNMHRQVAEIDTATNKVVSTFTATGAVHRLEAPLAGDRIWYVRGNDDMSFDLTSLRVGPAGTVVPTKEPVVVPTTNAPVVPPTTTNAPVVPPPTKAATLAPSPGTSATPSSGTVVAASDVALAATGPGLVLPMVGGALVLIAAGAVAMRRRKIV